MTSIKNVIISALDKKKIPIDHWWLHLDEFLQETNVAYEVSKCLSCSGILSANHGFSGSCDIMDHVDDKPSNKNHVNLYNGRLPDIPFGMTNKSVQKIDMATISQEGHGDIVQGIAQILMKCPSTKSCVIFMPRIDLWVVEEDVKIAEKTDSCSMDQLSSEMDTSCFTPREIIEKENGINTGKHPAEMIECQSDKKASYAWMTFIEQVESIGLSTSLMILATSQVPYTELPHKIRGFFKRYRSMDRQSTPIVQTVPQFSLQIDENFDHDLAINVSTIRKADLVTVLQQGSVSEIGTHDELFAIEENGVYAKLIKMQETANQSSTSNARKSSAMPSSARNSGLYCSGGLPLFSLLSSWLLSQPLSYRKCSCRVSLVTWKLLMLRPHN
ncbi:hypothetical protein KIW84_023651 [Lathyrus oleraceus]|uniref:Uncharacterized protein n=1 Tax=Pisum sativum TaxID=3888 RepID=A0A9D5BC83_PEA|nr:hypothetical protein KIW84_023651 [Pisum sativum]